MHEAAATGIVPRAFSYLELTVASLKLVFSGTNTAAFSLVGAQEGDEGEQVPTWPRLSLLALKVNLGLLLFSLLGFLLPSYLLYYRAQLRKEYSVPWEGPLKVPSSPEVTA